MCAGDQPALLTLMKIVLAEDRNGQLHGERSFAHDKVLIGRDPAVCHYFFSQEQWPMVSRKHAEFRLGDGSCTVNDVGVKGELPMMLESFRFGK